MGCKIDLREDRETVNRLKASKQHPVSSQEAEAAAKKIRIDGYIECSAIRNTGVRRVFDEVIATMILKNSYIEMGEEDDDENGDAFDFLNTTMGKEYKVRRPLTVPKEQKKEELSRTIKSEVVQTQAPIEGLFQGLLERGELSIDDLLVGSYQNELLKQFRMRNKKLIELLSHQETLSRLVEIVIGSDADLVRASIELLTADIPAMRGKTSTSASYYRFIL